MGFPPGFPLAFPWLFSQHRPSPGFAGTAAAGGGATQAAARERHPADRPGEFQGAAMGFWVEIHMGVSREGDRPWLMYG